MKCASSGAGANETPVNWVHREELKEATQTEYGRFAG